MSSAYTEVMTARLVSKGTWTFAEAEAFAKEFSLSTRSVVSKIKNLGLAYTPKPKAARKNPDAVRKADTVKILADRIGANPDKLAGLAKADVMALNELIAHLPEAGE